MVCGQCGQALNPSLKGKTTVHSSLIFCRKSCSGRVDNFFALIKLVGRAGLYQWSPSVITAPASLFYGAACAGLI